MEISGITNDQLSKMFSDVMSRTSLSPDLLRLAVAQIATCPRPIAGEFRELGNLSTFHIPRLAKKFYPVLESLLKQGPEKIAELAIRKDIAEMRTRAFVGIPGSSRASVQAETTSGGWDNATRAREEDKASE